MSGLDGLLARAGGGLAYTALAVVEADDDGTASLEIVTMPDPNGGADLIVGMKVDVTIVDGPFRSTTTVAQLCAPLGASTPTPPPAGAMLVLVLPSGSPDGGCYAIATVLGGLGAPIKAAIAGVDVANPDVLKKMRADAPPKGTGEVKYFRGAPYGIRLKGKQDDFSSEFFLEADDGTNIVLRWDPSKQCYCVKVKDHKGGFFQQCDGEGSWQSPNARNGIYVTDEGVRVVAVKFELNAEEQVTFDGGWIGLGLGITPPTPANAAVVGAAPPPTGSPGPALLTWGSTRVFIGAI